MAVNRARGVRSQGKRLRRVAIVACGPLLAFVGAASAASTDFIQPLSSPETVGIGPHGIVLANFDGDADVDLATVNISSGDVTVLKNNGNANFFEPASSPEDAGSFPNAIATADFDGDGDNDLAVSNQEDDSLTILKNNGNGNFFEPASSPEPVGDVPVAVAAADLDADGDRDLAVVSKLATGNVAILKNSGNGNFFEPSTSPETVGIGPVALAIADLDGDVDPDLAVADQQGNSVGILLNGRKANFYEPRTSPEPAGSFPQSVIAADLDRDGDRDLATVNQGSDNATVLRNSGSAEFTEFATSPEPVGGRPLDLVAANFDGVMGADLASANADDNDVSILANSGAGDFFEPPTSTEPAGSGPNSIAARDLDGDGDPDLAVANGSTTTVTILRNQ